MTIFVGNKLTLVLERDTGTAIEQVLTTEIVRKEFNAQDYDGVGYQRTMVSEVYGTTASHGIGFQNDGTALQIEATAFVTPIYRFDFSFTLTSQRLKEIYEFYLVLYNLRALGERVRIRMTDDRLLVSEPVDPIHGRIGVQQGSGLEQTEQNTFGYALKKAEYLISWENFEWRHIVGDIYAANILAVEVEVETDQNQGNICSVATPEVILPFDGFTLEEIATPTDLQGVGNQIDVFSLGFQRVALVYFGTFKINNDDYLVSWDPGAPGTSGAYGINYQATFTPEDIYDTSVKNPYALAGQSVWLERDEQSNSYLLKTFNTAVPPFTIDNFRENSAVPIHLYDPNTEVLEYQKGIEVSDPAAPKLVFIPRLIRDPITEVSSTANTPLRTYFEYGATNNVSRITLGEWAVQESGQQVVLVNDAQAVDNVVAELPGLFNPPRLTSVRLAGITGTFQRGAMWHGYRFNINTNTNFFTSFEMRMVNGTSPGADGLAFVIHNDARGTAALGLGGGGLGFSGWNGTTYDINTAIQPSIAITFDIFGNGAPYAEPASTPPDILSIVKNGKQGAITGDGGSLAVLALTTGINNAATRVTINFQGDINTLTITLTPLAGGPTEVHTFPAFDLWGQLGTPNQAWFGFTAATGGQTKNIYIDRWQVSHDTTFHSPASSSFRGDIITFDRLNNSAELRNRVFMGTETDAYFRDIVSVLAPVESQNTYYHIVRDPGNVNNAKVYRTTGPNPFQAGRVLVNSVTDGSIPVVDYGRQTPRNLFKFYFTQGSNSGNVYSTTDFVTFTNIGSWDNYGAANENEGVLYPFRNIYLFRSPSRFVLDVINDTFVDIRDLLCTNELGTAEEIAIFDGSREIVYVYATPPDQETEYQAIGEEQIIIATRAAATKDDFRIFKLQTIDVCP